jgi:hypothetical protein
MTDPIEGQVPADTTVPAKEAVASGPLATPGRLVPAVGLVVGACAIVPVLVGPKLNVTHDVEIADHLVPGVIVLAVSAAVLVLTRSGAVSGFAMLAAGLVVTLAGLWMAATHLPLVAQAARHDAPWGATIYHSASATLVLGFGLVWTATSWSDAG